MTKFSCCDVKPGESREFTVRIKLNCSSDDNGSCTITANCCEGEDQECCKDESE